MIYIELPNRIPHKVICVFEDDETELDPIWGFANMVEDNKRKHGIPNNQKNKIYSSLITNYGGLKGEYCTSKYYGLEMNRMLFIGGDSGADLIVPCLKNRKIQVKYSGTHMFILNDYSEFDNFDYGILVNPARYKWLDDKYREIDPHLPHLSDIEKTPFGCKNVIISGVVNRKLWDQFHENTVMNGNPVCVINMRYMQSPIYFHKLIEERRQIDAEVDEYSQ